VSEPWGEQPAPEEARHESQDEVDEPNGEQMADGHELDEPTADQETDAEPDVAPDQAPDDGPDEAPADEDLVAGEGPVATAVARLDSLVDLPPAEHVDVYEDVHRVLQDALAEAAHDSGGDGSGEDRTGSP
jgi:hypothetical protein